MSKKCIRCGNEFDNPGIQCTACRTKPEKDAKDEKEKHENARRAAKKAYKKSLFGDYLL